MYSYTNNSINIRIFVQICINSPIQTRLFLVSRKNITQICKTFVQILCSFFVISCVIFCVPHSVILCYSI